MKYGQSCRMLKQQGWTRTHFLWQWGHCFLSSFTHPTKLVTTYTPLSHHLEIPIPPPWFSSQVKKALTLLEDASLISSCVADTNLHAQTQVSKKHCMSLFSNKETSSVLPSRKFNPKHSWVLFPHSSGVSRFWVSESAKISGWPSESQGGTEVSSRCQRPSP